MKRDSVVGNIVSIGNAYLLYEIIYITNILYERKVCRRCFVGWVWPKLSIQNQKKISSKSQSKKTRQKCRYDELQGKYPMTQFWCPSTREVLNYKLVLTCILVKIQLVEINVFCFVLLQVEQTVTYSMLQ